MSCWHFVLRLGFLFVFLLLPLSLNLHKGGLLSIRNFQVLSHQPYQSKMSIQQSTKIVLSHDIYNNFFKVYKAFLCY